MQRMRFPSLFFRQRLNTVGIPFVFGVMAIVLLPALWGIGLAIFFILLSLLFSFFREDRETRISLILLAVGLSLALIVCGSEGIRQRKRAEFSDQTFSVCGTVTQSADGEISLLCCFPEGSIALKTLRIDGDFPFNSGDIVKGQIRVLPYLTDQDRQDGIFLRGEALSDMQVFDNDFFYSAVNAVRTHCLDAFGNTREGRFFKAILLGDRTGLSEEDQVNFQKIASSHLLAISGLHISILTGFFYFAAKSFFLSRRIANILFFPMIFFFYFLSGCQVSVFRAGFMSAFAILAAFLRRRADSVTALVFSACLLIGLNPYVIESHSFLFSFLSTFAIISVAGDLSNSVSLTLALTFRKKFWHRILSSFSSSVCTLLILAICIFTFTFPLQLSLYETVQVLSPIYSVILIPLFSPCVWLGVLRAIASFLPFSIPLLQRISAGYVGFFLDLVKTFSDAAPASVSFGSFTLLLILASLLLLLCCFVFRRPLKNIFDLYLITFLPAFFQMLT